MGTIRMILVRAVKWPTSWFQVEERDDIVATYYVKDHRRGLRTFPIRAHQLGEEIPLDIDVSSDSEWKMDVHTPGLGVTVSQSGRFA
jgi:hypothetical protein